MAFSASDAALEGFRVVRREPLSVLAWAGVMLVVGVAVMALFLPQMHAMRVMTEASRARPADPAVALAAMGGFMRLYAVMLPLELVVFAVLSAAVYRVVLRPADRGFRRLRLGADEARLIGLWLILGLLMLGLGIALAIVLVVLAGVVSIAAKSSPAAVPLSLFVLYLSVLAVLTWIGVRFSLAGPMTFSEKRIQLFGSWRLTRGRFWSLFGCYLLAFVLAVVMELAFLVLEAALALATSGGSLAAAGASLFRPDVSTLSSYFTPVRLVLLPIGAILGAALMAVMVAPSARAYGDIASETSAAG